MAVGNDLVRRCKPGSVFVDIAIDQGGCFEDSRPTTHLPRPRHGVLLRRQHAGGRAAHVTYALTNATLPYVLKPANLGWQAALDADPTPAGGLSTHEGALHRVAVARDLDLPYTEPRSLVTV